jgi:inorganic pyrophosphatase
MTKKKARNNGLADPSRLTPFDEDHKQTIQVTVETPKGSRNKYAFDPERRPKSLRYRASAAANLTR